jgi:hypothetical protein
MALISGQVDVLFVDLRSRLPQMEHGISDEDGRTLLKAPHILARKPEADAIGPSEDSEAKVGEAGAIGLRSVRISKGPPRPS